MSKWRSTIFAVFLVLFGLVSLASWGSILPGNSTARGLPMDDDDDGPTVETVLTFDFFHQHKHFAVAAPKQELDESVAGLALSTASSPLPEIFFRPFLVPSITLLAQTGLPPRAPAAA